MERKLSGGNGFRSAKIKFAVSCILLLLASSAAFSQNRAGKTLGNSAGWLNERSTSKRAAAVKALGLLQDNGLQSNPQKKRSEIKNRRPSGCRYCAGPDGCAIFHILTERGYSG